MTQYANLKDYFQNEHIKVIQEAISNHLKNDRQITEPSFVLLFVLMMIQNITLNLKLVYL